MLSVTCPRCKTSLRVPERLAGKTVRCKACNKPILIPGSQAPPESDPSSGLDLNSLEAIEQGGETLEFQRRRKRLTVKEAQELSGDTGTKKPRHENARICPACGVEVQAPDPYCEVLCLECDTPIPGLDRGTGEVARYADSLAGRVRTDVGFYTGFSRAFLYPIPALIWIMLGIAVALAAIVIPVGGVLAFVVAAALNPIAEKGDVSWVGLTVAIFFLVEGIYFGLVNYHILVDSIRATSSGSEVPPPLTWNPSSLGAALVGYLALGAYYVTIFLALTWVNTHHVPDFSSIAALTQPLHSPGSLAVLALLTFMVPMHLIGLASGRPADGLNPARVVRSILAVPSHYAFLFLITLMYVGIYAGVMVAVMSWAGEAIATAARTGVQKGLAPMGLGLAAWAVVIGLGFFIHYSLGRILGLFARTYKDKLDFDL